MRIDSDRAELLAHHDGHNKDNMGSDSLNPFTKDSSPIGRAIAVQLHVGPAIIEDIRGTVPQFVAICLVCKTGMI
jgi:hypothetical protein